MNFLRFILFVISFNVFISHAQKVNKDSLIHEINHANADSSRIKALIELAFELKQTKKDTSILLTTQALELSKKINWQKGIAHSYSNLGLLNTEKGEYKIAHDHFNSAQKLIDKLLAEEPRNGVLLKLKSSTHSNLGGLHLYEGNLGPALSEMRKALEIDIQIDNKKGIATLYNNIGSVYKKQANYPEALSNYLKSLKIYEEIKNQKGVGVQLGNIGNVYLEQDNYDEALKYYSRSVAIQKALGNKPSLAVRYGNMAIAYELKGDLKTSIDYFKQSLSLYEELNNRTGIATTYTNLGISFKKQGKYTQALEYYKKALDIHNLIGNQEESAITLNNMGGVLIKLGKFKEAESLLKRSNTLSDSLNATDNLKQTELTLSDLYDTLGRHDKALLHYRRYIEIRDSINSEDNIREQARVESNFEWEKKQTEERLKHEKEQELKNAEIERQKLQRNFSFIGIAALGIFAVLIFRSLHLTRKQKQIIEIKEKETQKQKELVELQKHIIEEKQKETIDSINYAKRLQEAILPPQRLVKELLPESFVIYKPKDIVAGDFYFLESVDDTIYFAVADCTGHGVPGALVSVVCSNALHRAVKEFRLTQPGMILDKTRELVIETFEKSESDVKDGMDVSFCAWNRKTGILEWSGANNPLWIIRNNELIDYKGDKQPIGKAEHSKPFTTHLIKLEKGDLLYIFSDGYADQFGGEAGKKLKSGKLKEIITSIKDQPMNSQRVIIENTFDSWKGQYEQVDDVCVIGVKI